MGEEPLEQHQTPTNSHKPPIKISVCQTAQRLKKRMQYATLKVAYGWESLSLNQIKEKLKEAEQKALMKWKEQEMKPDLTLMSLTDLPPLDTLGMKKSFSTSHISSMQSEGLDRLSISELRHLRSLVSSLEPESPSLLGSPNLPNQEFSMNPNEPLHSAISMDEKLWMESLYSSSLPNQWPLGGMIGYPQHATMMESSTMTGTAFNPHKHISAKHSLHWSSKPPLTKSYSMDSLLTPMNDVKPTYSFSSGNFVTPTDNLDEFIQFLQD